MEWAYGGAREREGWMIGGWSRIGGSYWLLWHLYSFVKTMQGIKFFVRDWYNTR